MNIATKYQQLLHAIIVIQIQKHYILGKNKGL